MNNGPHLLRIKKVYYRYLNKSLPKDIIKLKNMPWESEYYKIILE